MREELWTRVAKHAANEKVFFKLVNLTIFSDFKTCKKNIVTFRIFAWFYVGLNFLPLGNIHFSFAEQASFSSLQRLLLLQLLLRN